RARATSFCAEPLSALPARNRGSKLRTGLNSHRPPSRSWWSALVTHNAQIRPRESVRMNRLRPSTFFPPVVPPLTGSTGRLDRLAVDPPSLGLGRIPGLDPHVLPESF